MAVEEIYPAEALKGKRVVPGDKSISHRAVMFGSLAEGKTTVQGFLPGEDCLSTIDIFRKLGVSIEQNEDTVTIESRGTRGLQEPAEILDVGNSGTTARLVAGILAGCPFHSVLTGDASIARRPMTRVTDPLTKMGASIRGRKNCKYTPLSIQGQHTVGIHWISEIASAQVKSSILLCGLQSEGVTEVTEPFRSRDHTERMLEAFGVRLYRDENSVSLKGGQSLSARHVNVPGDISSAAFFLAAAAMLQGSEVTLENVGINPTRTGILDVLTAMEADFEIINERTDCGEPAADIVIRGSELQGTTIDGALIPRLIDEIPVLAVLATQANGRTVIQDAEELKVKETNRIDTVVQELKKFGASIEATKDGMIIDGPTPLTGADTKTYGDHRIGMAMAVASLAADGPSRIHESEAAAVSYPLFFEDLTSLRTDS
ncbi:3-phosphoshikimate 1-carboxyvinyltransferase [Salsuginibacillus halophilus]|uniref:3-phosphoshikimate 1-carboxyvinyltransferase n=1 Tax=Salsuginibacillus halophilus TaxID=517424 RepID=A0A2P8HWA9_9BACI|nr:3-phosphoshikimate 1-carboxyvinyltransferase [Salsuginibacillus halophilus]PSL50506.1 3-phosphoshikimate 1-carboxyvinyltransferase [Salsuginibacillus halophilus]